MKNLVFIIALFITSLHFAADSSAAKSMSVASPDGRLKVSIECVHGKLHYQVTRNGEVLLKRSNLSILKDASYKCTGSFQSTVEKTWQPRWGQFSNILDHHNQLSIQLLGKGLQMELVCRVYNSGIGLRFVLPEQAQLEGTPTEYAAEFLFDSDYSMFHPRGEVEPKGPIPLSRFDPSDRGPAVPALVKVEKDIPAALIPAVIDLEDCYLAILESDLYSSVFNALTSTMNIEPSASKLGLRSVNSARITGTSYQTPWRVILVEEQVGDLAINTVPLNLAAACQLQDTSWIRAGKSLWDWRVRGYQTDGFTYGVDLASVKRFIDFGADNNIHLLLLDWYWYLIQEGEFTPQLDIQSAIEYGKEKGVRLFLYWDEWRGGTLPLDKVFPLYSSLGAAGIKYGFRGNDAPFTAEAIRRAADNELTIDFHDLICPMVGVRRTYPNALTREYAHAQLDAGHMSNPSTFLKMVMINMITGPLDMNHGFYALNTAPETTTRKGWRLTLNSTVAGENARALICFSGLIILPDAPEEYQKKADLFEFLAEMPQADWDETRVLASKMAEHISVARRKGEAWFVGSAINESGGSLDLPLDFLSGNRAYKVTYYEDTEKTHYITNKESYRVRTGNVTSEDVVTVKMAPGGGHTMWIRPN